MEHKAGFVNILGNPNVGKSTIMNALVGERISIITSKSQTTRHRIMGIVNNDDFQIVYSDTPGILKPNYELQKSMMRFAGTALSDADILVYVCDVYETIDKNKEFIEKLKEADVPIILIINKIDLSNQEKVIELHNYWTKELPKAEILPMSATKKFNIDVLFDKILQYLPEHAPYFPKDQLTDRPVRFFISEIIREKILLNYQKEIPYSTEVVVEEYHEEDDIVNIRALIYVVRDSQKAIIIGKQGSAIKKTGIQARKDIEQFINKHIYLKLLVKVKKDWRNNEGSLKNFGYI